MTDSPSRSTTTRAAASSDWRCRELRTDPDIAAAAAAAVAWGFPRLIEPYEIERGDWFAMGDSVVWWYEPADERLPGLAVVHLAVAPEARSRWPARRWLVAVELFAEVMGCDRVGFPPLGGALRAVEYTLRAGWVRDGALIVRRLGGQPYGRHDREHAQERVRPAQARD